MSEEGTEFPVTEVTVIGSCNPNMGDGNLGLGLEQMMKLPFEIKPRNKILINPKIWNDQYFTH